MENNNYFTNDFSKSVWTTTYKLPTESTIEDTWKRVAKAVASVEETEENKIKYEKVFNNLLKNFKFVPGGRILSNAGTGFTSTCVNCFVGTKPEIDVDSLDGICEILRTQILTLASEGGYGLNFGFIRPRGGYVKKRGIRTPGAVKYMELFDKSSEIITEGAGDFELEYEKIEGKPDNEKKKIRKGAQIFLLPIWHPDIIEFIEAKRIVGRLTKANLSVQMTNEFMDRLIEVMNTDKDDPKYDELNTWQLVFPDTNHPKFKTDWYGNIVEWRDEKKLPVKVYKTIKLTDIWEKIMQSTYNYNDPGILFTDIANATNCASYLGKAQYIEASNPCGEITMGAGSSCLLSSWNLTTYIKLRKDKTPYFDFKEFETDIADGLRFMDNVATLTEMPLPEYKTTITEYRRLGMGFMGLGSTLMILGLKYGSPESVEFTDKVLNILNFEAIKGSILLSGERGPYKDCDWQKHFENVKRIFNLTSEQIEELTAWIETIQGFRNVALFTVPPTGNTGCLANNVSGGVEPIFALTTYRLVGVPEIPEELKDKCPKFWEGDMTPNEFFKEKEMWGFRYLEYKEPTTEILYKITKDRGLCKEVEIKDFAVDFIEKNNLDKKLIDESSTAMQLTVDKHINILNVVANHLDQSCSKTVNLPSDYKYEDMMNLYLDAYKTGRIKGITTFRDGTRMAVLTDKKSDDKDCPCMHKSVAVKRPKELDCKLHLLNIKGVSYYVIVGFLGEDPYEVFMGENLEDIIDDDDGEVVGHKVIFKSSMNNIEGKMIKKANKQYVFTSEDFTYYISRKDESDEKATITSYSRILSCALKHGTPIKSLVEQMEKTSGSFAAPLKVITRVLKKYIKDGEEVQGEVCPECGGKLVRKEGCKSCVNCGWSACG